MMQKRRLKFIAHVSVALVTVCTSAVSLAYPTMWQLLRDKTAAKKLYWKKSSDPCKLCGGFFFQPKNLMVHPNPLPATQLPSNISAHGPTEFQQNGMSRLTGGVVVTQPGRRITADTAFVRRNGKTGKIVSIDLIGDVHFQQYNRLIVAMSAYMDLIHHRITLKHALYHMGPAKSSETNQTLKIKLNYNAWGYAGLIHNPSENLINLHQTTYSTCSPLNQVWMLSSRDMHFNRERGFGEAKHVVLRFYKIPVAYFPYLRFPIDNRRLSGFLVPSFSHSRRQGTRIGLPFYWNMAPNYDMTITPYYNFKRGFQLSDQFRFLTKNGRGLLQLSYLPDDKGFEKYRNDMISNYANTPGRSLFVDKLRGMHDWRGFFGFNGDEQWSDDWHTNFHLNYVTDPYYFRDINTSVSFADPNQLLNEVDAQYQGEHWNFTGMVEGYQTLHRIDQFEQPIYDQYTRLPEFDASAFYPSIWRHLNAHMSSQAVNFEFYGDYPTATPDLPTPNGLRFHGRPSLDYDQVWSSGYIDPQVSLDTTSYYSHFTKTTGGVSRPDFDKTRVMPIVDVDTGLYFDRAFKALGSDYVQTLEPRLFYLYVPYKNQDEYPNFDTQLLPFSYNQLYSLNRFTGYDRLDNANQMSLGLTSRILNSDDGQEKIRAQLGMIYYLQDPKVSLPGVSLTHETFSPLVGSLSYDINPNWVYTGSAAWDFHNEHLNNAGTHLTYRTNINRLFTFGYRFVREDGDDLLGKSLSTNQLYGGFSTPFLHQWTGFAYAAYDFSGDYPESYFAGMQYDSCCWALRFVFNRRFTGRSPSSTPSNIINQYDNVYYVQLQLKGLASVGNNSAASLLTSKLPGYQDPFAEGF